MYVGISIVEKYDYEDQCVFWFSLAILFPMSPIKLGQKPSALLWPPLSQHGMAK